MFAKGTFTQNRSLTLLLALGALAVVVVGLGITRGPRPVSPIAPAGEPAVAAAFDPQQAAMGLAVYHQSERNSTPALDPSAFLEALAIYHQSEWGRAPAQASGFSADGLALYQHSERNRAVNSRANAAGLAMYQQSERDSALVQAASLSQQALAIYHASEWGDAAPSSLDAGLATYHQSEWGRVPDRAQQFNAYQRSEWLGADR